MTTQKIPLPAIQVIKPDSDPSELIAAITHLIRQLGTTMLSDVAIHAAEQNDTKAEQEWANFTTKVDEVANKISANIEEVYQEQDEMLGTMVLASLLSSVRLMQQFETACEEFLEGEEEKTATVVGEDFEFEVPTGVGLALNGSKYEH